MTSKIAGIVDFKIALQRNNSDDNDNFLDNNQNTCHYSPVVDVDDWHLMLLQQAACSTTFVMIILCNIISYHILINLMYIPYIKKLIKYERELKLYKVTVKSSLQMNSTLTSKVTRLQKQVDACSCEKKIHEKLLKTDKDAIFYTGMPNLKLFNSIHNLVSNKVRRKWKGGLAFKSNIVRNFKKSPKKFGPQSKLSSKDELLMTLMKLRLGSLEKDLADRFGVSITLVSQIFATWTRALAMELGPLVYVPDMGTINATKPKQFKELPKLHSIADGTELFIQTPKNHDLQRMTWSSYKHHNTVKFLVVVAPNSAIIFISAAYAGSISDKALTVESGYLDLMEPYTELMVDKGFNIAEECAARQIYLRIPPGRWGESQMLVDALKKTTKVATLRIEVEQVIRRFKTFRILSQEMPISLLSHIDDITLVCAALCNLQTPLYT